MRTRAARQKDRGAPAAEFLDTHALFSLHQSYHNPNGGSKQITSELVRDHPLEGTLSRDNFPTTAQTLRLCRAGMGYPRPLAFFSCHPYPLLHPLFHGIRFNRHADFERQSPGKPCVKRILKIRKVSSMNSDKLRIQPKPAICYDLNRSPSVFIQNEYETYRSNRSALTT